MIQTISNQVTFDQFIEWIPENSQTRYELHNGLIVDISQPLGGHEEIIGLLVTKLVVDYSRLKLPYFVPRQALVKAASRVSGYFPKTRPYKTITFVTID